MQNVNDKAYLNLAAQTTQLNVMLQPLSFPLGHLMFLFLPSAQILNTLVDVVIIYVLTSKNCMQLSAFCLTGSPS